MKMPTSTLEIEAGWRSYLKAIVFLVPPLFVWFAACIYLFPKAQQIWRDTGFEETWAIRPMQIGLSVTENAGLIAIAVVALLVLLERRADKWPRFRPATLWAATFVLNSSILIILMIFLAALLMAAPALAELR